jgi:hypothetical protein
VGGFSRPRVLNISNPASPTEVGFYATPDYARGVAVEECYAFVADGYDGLRILNVSNPANPTEVGFYNTPGEAFGVAVGGTLAYVADQNYFGIYDCSAAVVLNAEPPRGPTITSYALHEAYPNPFNPVTTITYDLMRDGHVSLTVYDVLGRSVATLFDGQQAVGQHRVAFDATGLAGGVYFCRMNAGTFTQTQKLVLVR